jgi:pilus assembly protein CpaB
MLFLGGGTLLFSSVLIAALLVVQSQSVQAKQKEISVEPLNEEVALGTVVLLAANSKVPKGTKLTPAYIREVHWPRDQVPEGAVRKLDDIESMFTTTTLVENQPILRSSLAATPPSLGIGDLLTPGMRAVTINVNATSGIEGWANP